MLERLFWRIICIIQKSVVPLHNESQIIQRPMKIKQIAFYALILLAVAAVTSPVSASDPYFCTTEMPNALRYLPGPPARSDRRFAYDSSEHKR